MRRIVIINLSDEDCDRIRAALMVVEKFQQPEEQQCLHGLIRRLEEAFDNGK